MHRIAIPQAAIDRVESASSGSPMVPRVDDPPTNSTSVSTGKDLSIVPRDGPPSVNTPGT